MNALVRSIGLTTLLFLVRCASNRSPSDTPPQETKPSEPDGGVSLPPNLTPEGFEQESQRLLKAAEQRFGDYFELQVDARTKAESGVNSLGFKPLLFAPTPILSEVFIVGTGSSQEATPGTPYFFVGEYSPDVESLGFFVFGLNDNQTNRLSLPLLNEETGAEFTVSDQVRWVTIRFQQGGESVGIHCNETSTPPCESPLESMEWVLDI